MFDEPQSVELVYVPVEEVEAQLLVFVVQEYLVCLSEGFVGT